MLRRQMRVERSAVPEAAVAASARQASLHVTRLAEFSGAAKVGLYAAFAGELPTRPLFEAARAAGKICLFPVVSPARKLRFHPLERWDDLQSGRYGVPEPPAGGEGLALDPCDLAVVPGLAFDVGGGRVGSGAGYYDRTFPPGLPAPLLVGFAFDLQRVDCVPGAAHDRAMDVLVTECGVWRTGAEQR